MIVLVVMPLICKSPAHHWLHSMSNIAVHDYIVFLDYCNATLILVTIFHILRLATLMILLGLHNVASQHLRIFYFNLWVVEDVVIVINILNYLDWLLPIILLLRL